MTPETVRLIGQEIRHRRGILTAEERWARALGAGSGQREALARIEFWRGLLTHAERRLASVTVEDPPSTETRRSAWQSRASAPVSSLRTASGS